MASDKEYFVLWDMDGTLFEFIYGGDIYRKGYFEQLGSNRNLIEAAGLIDEMRIDGLVLRSGVLSNYLTDSPHDVLQEKNNALDRETDISSGRRIFIPCGTSKWEAVCRRGLSDRAILIDDFGRNLSDWKGPKIKVSKDAEDMKKERCRYAFCISPESMPAEIVSTILAAIVQSHH